MAWHILHGLLEQVRVHSTFPGKLWIIMMFIFRIVIVARIGDMVYEDEQHSFICNTLTPGCPNVCFNRFSPISQLRYWSLMVLVVAVPGILFCIYASHKIYHAHVKFPEEDEEEEERTRKKWEARSDASDTYIHPPSMKRSRRETQQGLPSFANATAPPPPLYEVKRLNSSKKNGELKYGLGMKGKGRDMVRRRRHKERGLDDEDKDLMERRKGSTTDNNYTSTDELAARRWHYGTNRMGYPIYTDAHGRMVEYIKKPKRLYSEEIQANKEKRRVLENPTLFRAYWWHVFVRTILEVGFLVGQYYLYGWMVPELFECTRDPCPKSVDCYVSRPMEKSCFLWLMYGLGFFACLLSVAEFWTLGWKRFKFSVCCIGQPLTYEEKRRRLAMLQHNVEHSKKPHAPKDEIVMMERRGFTSAISLDSLSSETTVESV